MNKLTYKQRDSDGNGRKWLLEHIPKRGTSQDFQDSLSYLLYMQLGAPQEIERLRDAKSDARNSHIKLYRQKLDNMIVRSAAKLALIKGRHPEEYKKHSVFAKDFMEKYHHPTDDTRDIKVIAEDPGFLAYALQTLEEKL